MSKLDISFTRYNGQTVAEELWLFDVSPFQNFQSKNFGTFLMLLLEALEEECRDEILQTQHEFRDELITYFKNCMEANRRIIAPLENIRSFLALCRRDDNLCNVRTLNLFWTLLKFDIPRSRHLVDYGLLNIDEFLNYRSHFTIGDRRVNPDKLMSTMEFITSEKSNELYITDTTHCNDLVDLCYAYLYQLFSAGKVIKTCKNCGKTFVSKHGEEYCSKVSPQDSTKLCSDFAQPIHEVKTKQQEQEAVDTENSSSDNTVSEYDNDISTITDKSNDISDQSINTNEENDNAQVENDNADAKTEQSEQQIKPENEQTEVRQEIIDNEEQIQAAGTEQDDEQIYNQADSEAVTEVEQDDIIEQSEVEEEAARLDNSADIAQPQEAIEDEASGQTAEANTNAEEETAQKQQSSSNKKHEDAAKLHRQIYMRKQMLVKRNPDNKSYAEAFEQYKLNSKAWKKDVKSGAKTEEQFLEWLYQIKEESSR